MYSEITKLRMMEPLILGVLSALWDILELLQQAGKALISFKVWAFPFEFKSIQKLRYFLHFFLSSLVFKLPRNTGWVTCNTV